MDQNYYTLEAGWRLYASLNYFINVSGNGLSPVECYAITGNNGDLLLIEPSGTILNKTKIILIEENELENIVRKISAIFSSHKFVNSRHI